LYGEYVPPTVGRSLLDEVATLVGECEGQRKRKGFWCRGSLSKCSYRLVVQDYGITVLSEIDPATAALLLYEAGVVPSEVVVQAACAERAGLPMSLSTASFSVATWKEIIERAYKKLPDYFVNLVPKECSGIYNTVYTKLLNALSTPIVFNRRIVCCESDGFYYLFRKEVDLGEVPPYVMRTYVEDLKITTYPITKNVWLVRIFDARNFFRMKAIGIVCRKPTVADLVEIGSSYLKQIERPEQIPTQ
jgi:hypothetical protein